MRPVVVGIDPGTYIGIAIFDLNNNLIYSATITNKGKEGVVSEISKYGNPVIVASDVNPPPQFVTQIASYFNARLFYPHSTISDLTKTIEASKYKFSSVHERDAIVAVLTFFKENSNKIRWIERVLRDKNLSNIEEEVKRYVFGGMRVDDAIRVLVPVEEEYKKIMEYARSLPDAPQSVKVSDRRESDKDTMVGLLESNMRLRARLSIVEEELRLLKSELNKEIEHRSRSLLFSRDMKIRRLKRVIKMKNEKIKYLYKLIDSLTKKGKLDKEKKTEREDSKNPISETAKEKDLKNEDITLSIEKIVKEYRSSRFKGNLD